MEEPAPLQSTVGMYSTHFRESKPIIILYVQTASDRFTCVYYLISLKELSCFLPVKLNII
jgi:hypothetical protein